MPITSGAPSAQSTPTATPAACGCEADALGVEPHRDALGLEDVADRVRDVLVLAPDQPRPLLDHRHLAAEAAEHLGEFEADIAAADHHQMLAAAYRASSIEVLVR